MVHMETVSLTIRIPPDLHQQLQDRAKQEDRTLASLIRVLLAQAVRPDVVLPEKNWTDEETAALLYAVAHNVTGPVSAIDPAAVKAWAESRQR